MEVEELKEQWDNDKEKHLLKIIEDQNQKIAHLEKPLKMNAKWKCFQDKILIQPISAEETFSGLYIPDTSTNLKKGKVIAAGPGKERPMEVEAGQTVLYKQDQATQLTLDGGQYVICIERDVWIGD